MKKKKPKTKKGNDVFDFSKESMSETWKKLSFLLIPPDTPKYVVDQQRDLFFMGAWAALSKAKLLFEGQKWKYPSEEITHNFVKVYAEIYRYVFKSFFDDDDRPKDDYKETYKDVRESAYQKLEEQLNEYKEGKGNP